jgi:mevalonate kinase
MKAVAEAPTKVIITGEHFVVHGAWALATAIPRKVRVEVQQSSRFKVSSDRFRSSGHPALRPVAQAVEAMSREFAFDPRVKVSIRSEIPGGAGLGSSASTMVALVSALSKLNRLGLRVQEIVQASMVGEKEIHGNPSGIDPAVCARGGVILFRRGSVPTQVRLKGTRSLIVSLSGMKRSTRHQIGRVSAVKREYPSLFAGLADSANSVSLMAADRLSTGDMAGLGSILNFSHAVLSSLGVSNPTLDRLVNESLSLGSYGAKLTGAGGGGSIISVGPEGKEKRITSGLNARGFETFIARVPVGGVRSWLEP